MTAWLGPAAGQTGTRAALDSMWRVRLAETEGVLGTLGEFHPDKLVAKDARKAFSSSARVAAPADLPSHCRNSPRLRSRRTARPRTRQRLRSRFIGGGYARHTCKPQMHLLTNEATLAPRRRQRDGIGGDASGTGGRVRQSARWRRRAPTGSSCRRTRSAATVRRGRTSMANTSSEFPQNDDRWADRMASLLSGSNVGQPKFLVSGLSLQRFRPRRHALLNHVVAPSARSSNVSLSRPRQAKMRKGSSSKASAIK